MGLEGPLPIGLPNLRAVSSRVTTHTPQCLSSTTVRTFLWTGFLGDPKNLVQVGSHSGSKLEERGISETKQRSACACVHKYSSRRTPHVRKVATKPETRTHGRKVPVCSRSSPPLAALVPPTAYELIQARASSLSIATTSIVPPTLEARGTEYCKAPVCSGFERVPLASLNNYAPERSGSMRDRAVCLWHGSWNTLAS